MPHMTQTQRHGGWQTQGSLEFCSTLSRLTLCSHSIPTHKCKLKPKYVYSAHSSQILSKGAACESHWTCAPCPGCCGNESLRRNSRATWVTPINPTWTLRAGGNWKELQQGGAGAAWGTRDLNWQRGGEGNNPELQIHVEAELGWVELCP